MSFHLYQKQGKKHMEIFEQEDKAFLSIFI